MRVVLLALLVAFAIAETKNNHWAVIVAGSDGYWNYRHQADTCHAYHIMKNNGIPEDHIIHFAYDDIANNKQNPFPGMLFNAPDGEDVYAGCNIDYRGADVTPAKFLSVLRGEEQANDGKTLKATKDDKVFINFSDHGAPGLIAFPKGTLYAKDLMETLHFMHDNQLYKEMVLYIEACESGSMFEGLLSDDMNIYATTAANPHESSWGYYCYPDDQVNGKHIGSCLGDLYSVVWMEDSDAQDSCVETIEQQTDIVIKKTTKSEVCEYGDKSIKSELVGDFEGVCGAKKTNIFDTLVNSFKSIVHKPHHQATAWDSRDIKLHYLYNKYMRSNDKADSEEFTAELEHRQVIEGRFSKLQSSATGVLFMEKPVLKHHDCYKDVVDTYHEVCGENEYALKFFKNFVSLCNSTQDHAERIALVRSMC